MSPYIGGEISWQPGWLYSIVGLFPPFDSVAFMLIVKEYPKVIQGLFPKMFNKSTVEPTTGISHPSVTHPSSHTVIH